MNKRVTLVMVLMFLVLATVWSPVAVAAQAPAPTRISFQPGATSGTVSGQLAARGARTYVLRAAAGQHMQVSLSASGNTRLVVRGANGVALNAGAERFPGWQGRLPRTQDYTVQVSALDQSVSYCLRVTVYARVQFAAGATSASLSSPIQRCTPAEPEEVGGYVLRALAGQTMRVTLDSPNDNTNVTIMGADGVALKFYDDWNANWEGVLPATQDYYLLPIAVGPDPRFNLTVWISALGQPAPPTRIRFAPGATSGSVSGHLAPGAAARYVLWAARGQRMQLDIAPASSAAIDVTVTGPDGRVWRGLPLHSAIDPLPLSGSYYIALTLRPGSGGVNYRMQVTIPAR